MAHVVAEKDSVPDADRPLEASFTWEGASAVVIVRDLCRVVGRPADVAHVLKGPFDEDRAAKLPRNAHRYFRNGDIANQFGRGKASVAKSVDRCRKTIEDAFELGSRASPGKRSLDRNPQRISIMTAASRAARRNAPD
jgi:hypothetical protein